MITCQELASLLVDYLDGDCSDELRADLDAHLAHCPPCEAFLREYRTTSTICREKLAREMPDALRDRLLEYLRTQIPGGGSA